MQKLIFSMVVLALIASPLSAADTDGPIVSTVSPLSAVFNIPQTFWVTATDASDIDSCMLIVSSTYETPMTYSPARDRWEVEYTFTTERTANSIRAVCLDDLFNRTNGKSRIVSVSSVPVTSPHGEGDDALETREVDASAWVRTEIVAASPVLIKLVCPGGEDATHPCRTVYFLDNIGKRHAFPNEKVYFTWYADYTDVHLVTGSMMASFTLGKNVTYHPGTKMVKFPSVRTVYAVSRMGELRPVASETIATSLYGADWNKLIDDVSEAFYGNYSYGASITSTEGYSIQEETGSVESINDNLPQ